MITIVTTVLVVVAIIAGAVAYRRTTRSTAVATAIESGTLEQQGAAVVELSGTTVRPAVEREMMCPVYEKV